MKTLIKTGEVIGWTILGGIVMGLIGFVLAILTDAILGLSRGGGDPAIRGLSAVAITVELLFLAIILAGMVAGCAYGIRRARKLKSPE